MAGQSTPSSKEATATHRFAPVPPGDRALAALLVLVAAFVLWAFWGLMPDFPRITRGTLYVFLLAGACLAGALAALRHTPHQAEVEVTRDGIYLRASGGAPIAAITLGWADIERITFRTMNNSRHVFLVFTCGPGSPRPGRELALHGRGLSVPLSEVMAAIAAEAEADGAVGPRPRHIGSWFNGLTWRLEPADHPPAGGA